MADPDIDVTVRLRDELSRQVRQSRAALDALERQVADLNREMREGAEASRRQAEELDRLRRAAGGATSSTSRFQRAMKKSSGDSQAFGKALGSIKMPVIISGITLAATAVSALGAAGIAGAAGLAPLVGVLGVIPALLSPIAALAPVLILGFKGIGEAFGVLSNPASDAEAIAAAYAKLSKPQHEFVDLLLEAKKQSAGLKDTIQAGFLPGVGAGLRSILPLLPVLEEGLGQSAQIIGDLTGQGGAALGTWGADLGIILANANGMLGFLGTTLGALGTALKDLTVVGGPLATQFFGWIAGGATELARLTASGRDSGELLAFLQSASDLAASVGAVLWDVVVALFNVGTESQVLGDVMGGGLATAAADFRAFTESVEGQTAIKTFFSDAVPVVQEVGLLILDLVKGFGELAGDESLAPVIAAVREDLLPALLTLASGVTSNLGPAVVSLVTSWVKFSSVLSFEPIITLANTVADVVAAITDWIKITPGAATGVATLLAGVLALKVALAIFRISGLSAVVGAIPAFVTGLRAGTLATATMSTGQKIAAITGRALRLGMMAIGVAGRFMGKGLYAALGPFGLIILAVAAIAAGLMYAYNNSETFRNFVDRLHEKLKVAFDNVKIAIGDAGRVIGEVAEKFKVAWGNVVIAWNDAGRVIREGATAVWDWIVAGVSWLVGMVVAYYTMIWEIALYAWGKIAEGATWLFDWVVGQAKNIWSGYVYLFGLIRDFVIGVFDRVVAGATILAQWVGDKAKDVWTNWVTWFTLARDFVVGIFTGIGEKSTELWDAAKAKFGEFIEKLQGITLPGWIQTLADLIKTIAENVAGGVGKLREFFSFGDAPAPRVEGGGGSFGSGPSSGGSFGGGRSAQGYTGTALARVNQMGLGAGLRITSTYRSPARNRAVGGSPTSLHMDRNNPAVDIGGPTAALDRMAGRLRAMGGWRQLLWRVAGHYDHLHVAHEGGPVDPSWATLPGLKPDERPGILQTGERVLSRAQNALYERQLIPAPRSPLRAQVSAGAGSGDRTVHEYGDTLVEVTVHADTELDVEGAVLRAIEKAERNRRERR